MKNINTLSTTTFSGRRFTRKQLEQVQECHMVSGGFDYLIKVRASDMQAYRSFLGHELADIANVRETHTYVVMQEVKVESSITIGV